MKTTIVLTMAEQKRVEVIQRVFRGEVTMARGGDSARGLRAPQLQDQGPDQKGGG